MSSGYIDSKWYKTLASDAEDTPLYGAVALLNDMDTSVYGGTLLYIMWILTYTVKIILYDKEWSEIYVFLDYKHVLWN